MGSLGEHRYDVFISYARKDERASGGFVEKFEEVLGDQLAAKPDLLGDREPSIFKDSDTLLANGSLRGELREAVADSFALFVFVGDSYGSSGWCADELKWFIEKRFGARLESAQKHIFVICMTADGGKRVEERAKPEAKKFWSDQIRRNFYDEKTGRTIPHNSIDRDNKAVTSPEFLERVKQISETLIDRAGKQRTLVGGGRAALSLLREAPVSARAQTTSPSSRPVRPIGNDKPARVVIGSVTNDLMEIREELAGSLTRRGVEVTLLEARSLQSLDLEPLRQQLRGRDLMIQPISRAPLLFPDIDGGHLKLQKRAAKGIVDLWWWSPLTSAARTGPEEDDEDSRRFLDQVALEARKGTAASLAAQICGALGVGRGHAKILIESSEDEINCWEHIAELVRGLWGERYEGIALRDDALNFQNLRLRSPEALRECHGVMLLYGRKDYEALRTQADFLWDSLIELGVNPARAVASIVPPQPGDPDVDYVWPTIRFERGDSEDALRVMNEKKLEVFVERLHRAVTRSRGDGVAAPEAS